VRAQLASVVTALESVYAIFFAALLLGEVPSVRTLLGGAVILGAVVVATLGRHKE
jgi:drug/metabolite transporter (DMT)-like permease